MLITLACHPVILREYLTPVKRTYKEMSSDSSAHVYLQPVGTVYKGSSYINIKFVCELW